MNYSKSIKKKDIAKRIITSWVIVAVVFSTISGFVAWGITYNHFNGGQTEGKEAVEVSKVPTETAIFVYGSPDGRINNAEVSVNVGSELKFKEIKSVKLDKNLQEFIFYLSAAYNIDYTLVLALIQQESNFDMGAISDTGDHGLMQINECNFETLAEALNIDDFDAPYNNVRGGLYLLRKLFEKYETPERVLMAYNMGEYGASQLWEHGIFESNYSRSILLKQAAFQNELKGVEKQ